MINARTPVAYLGPPASYSHQATLNAFAEEEFNLVPKFTIEDIFDAVHAETASRGVVPFENSSNGSVVFTLDLFADIDAKFPDVEVCDEVYVDVHHCLLGHKLPATLLAQSPTSSGSVTPTTTEPYPSRSNARLKGSVGHIKKLYSHPQAWGQCNAFLSTYLKRVERQDVSSTSKAAEIVARDTTHTSAAISSIIAAEVHQIDVLAQNIEDRSNNTTRFFVIRKSPEHSSPPEIDDESGDDMQKFKTMISFVIDHENPGALANALAVFQKYNLNLTSINARPSGVAKWNYIFLVEVRGRRSRDGSGAVDAALADLDKTTKQWRCLGSWRSRLDK